MKSTKTGSTAQSFKSRDRGHLARKSSRISERNASDRQSNSSNATNTANYFQTDKRNPATTASPVTTSISPLQDTAQAQAWTYMTETLKHQLDSSRHMAEQAIRTREELLAGEEADIADARRRVRTERVLNLYNELSETCPESSHLPEVTKIYLQYEAELAEIVSEALRISRSNSVASSTVVELKKLRRRIQNLFKKFKDQELFIKSLIESTPATSEAIRASQVLLSILTEYMRHLVTAQAFIETRKDTLRIALHAESMGVTSRS